jgi:hypothetical protein
VIKEKRKEKKLKRLFLLPQLPISFNVSDDGGKKIKRYFHVTVYTVQCRKYCTVFLALLKFKLKISYPCRALY